MGVWRGGCLVVQTGREEGGGEGDWEGREGEEWEGKEWDREGGR